MTHQREYDVIIAGGGPAGSTAATLLAQYGHRVLLLEKGRHPRFHIGESMLPYSEPVIQRLGLDWSEGNVFKSGAVFIDEALGKRMFFQLSGGRRAYQVDRSEFDRKLFENAAKHGAETRQNCAVEKVDFSADQVVVDTRNGRFLGRYLVDATGRNAMLGRRQRALEKVKTLGNFALYSHYASVEGQLADQLFETGNIWILMVDVGWLWVIPLAGKRVSIGLVVRGRKPEGVTTENLFHHYVGQSALLNQLLEGADQCWPVKSEANFSFLNRARYGPRFISVGDAAGFLDPVFSSGVFLALTGAARAADRIHQGLVEGKEGDPRLHQPDDHAHKLGFNTMYTFVERFYQSRLIKNVFFEAHRDAHIKQAISELLAGNLWSGNNPWQATLLKGRFRLDEAQ
ncbi:MAG: pyridine nucleotide-disulfide oxidoreductase [Methylothermaceae bacteria B42]|nr:MAG: pyridine nucleotide-disulfide oxidoreductase [Methylothermaceae bacteria B42]HHJ40378.1 NAD(P)/FAD-dependent oxidoreductase [Methylothermaceae bacterium]